MREHEVPTHVEAEDRVLLWFTFPQIVAMVAVCSLSYGVYAYAPVGPSQLRVGLAVLLGLIGIAMVVGKIGGRRLPQVAADLLKYGLGARTYAGTAAQLTRPEPPPLPEASPSPMLLLGRRLRRTFNRLRRSRRERRNGRMPLRPRRWFERIRRKIKEGGKGKDDGNMTGSDGKQRGVFRVLLPVFLGLALLAVFAVSTSTVAMADGHETNPDHWIVEELGSLPPAPVTGRRLFLQGLKVSGGTATVTLKAATDLELTVRAYGGIIGFTPIFDAVGTLKEGQTATYAIPLTGNNPTVTLAWKDSLNQAGALLLKGEQIPHPLPAIRGEICDLTVTSLGWEPGSIEGVVKSDCKDRVRKLIALNAVKGHVNVGEMSLMQAEVTGITGVVGVATTGSRTTVPFVPNGETSFELEAGSEKGVHPVIIVAETEAALSIPLPPLTLLTHHAERTEERVRTVTLTRPGITRTVSRRVSVEHDDGTTTEHTISATLSIPSREIDKKVTLSILHPERIEAQVDKREPAIRSSTETLTLMATVASDDSYDVLNIPAVGETNRYGTQAPISASEAERLQEHFNGEYVPW